MVPLSNTLKKIHTAFPYLYFAVFGLSMAGGILVREQGIVWVALGLFIAAIFLVQWKYQFRFVDDILAGVTLIWSVWMLLAAYSDIIKAESLSWSFNLFAMVAYVLLNFYASISLVLKRQNLFTSIT